MANKNETVEVRVPIGETFTMPSNGKLYNGQYPAEISLRAMTTLDEKIRLSSSGLQSLVALLNSCIITEGIDASKLKMFDAQYLIYMLRSVTYGSKYKVNTYCPSCDKSVEVEIDLDDLEVKHIEEDFGEPFDIGPLPKSGDVIGCKILSIGEIIEIEKEARKILNKFKDYVGDPEFILSYKYMIDTINGNRIPDYQKQKYVEDMNAQDLRYLDSIYDKIANGYGTNTEIFIDCPICGETLHFNLPITDEFFRPKYNI